MEDINILLKEKNKHKLIKIFLIIKNLRKLINNMKFILIQELLN
jgi:hypothetical protein